MKPEEKLAIEKWLDNFYQKRQQARIEKLREILRASGSKVLTPEETERWLNGEPC